MASSIYLKIDKISGASKNADFAGQIEVFSFSHGVSFPMTSGERSNEGDDRQGRSQHEAFTIVKKADDATPNLFLYCSSGEQVGKATISIQGNNKSKIFSFELDKVFITSVSISGSPGDDPMETVTLNYSSIKWTEGASNSTAWDLETNAKK
ncbi:type VI secretion system tube protein Hcp [Archangium violaceum]|uniref:Hcp family type VI secretion system effector n=1 Tax=Archangium violaceum TaxID=83451 RepID=UPI00193C0258|nr:type VI secretion system tube protein Hcp [Archangium violaceum]QRK05079.1 type VI secretion system tube protein Hcp [Archangium violaceum]